MPAAPDALVVLALAVPVALSAVWPVDRLRRGALALAPWAAVPALILAVWCLARPDAAPAATASQVLTGLRLRVDPLGASLLLVTALLWVAGGAFARSYHAADPRRERFFGFFVVTMAGNLGLVLAADLVTFYLSFAVMTFAAYGLVVHRQDGAALRAGRVYIRLALVGEVAILAGLFALGAAADGALGFGPELGEAWTALAADGATLPAAALLVAGFAVKAGLVPLHVWLPLAHPAAPTAASALLSGAMIKAGLLGWLRVAPETMTLPTLGAVVLVVGILTALYGVAVGLAQDDPKVVLAYSSVSQMGTMALGLGLMLTAEGLRPVALTATVVYALHHGVAKAALFLAVGLADRLPASRAGPGPARSWRVALRVGVALPALALAGAPLTSGAAAKGLLKRGLGQAEGDIYPVLDGLLVVAAVGTTLLLARFFVTLEARLATRVPASTRPAASVWGLVAPWAVLVGAGLTAPWWLAWAVPVGAGVAAPAPGEGLLGALIPVFVGVAVAWAVARRPGLLGRVGRARVPPGDLLEPIAAVARRLAVTTPLARWRGVARSGAVVAYDRVGARLLSGPPRELGILRGPVLGLLLLGLVVALAVALAL